MSKYYLAIDIGASSGRHILSHIENNTMVTEEIYRFENGNKEVNGTLIWDTDSLFKSILTGMRKCKEIGKIPVSVGIDTWGVDFVLLDENDKMLGPAVAYRDSRTEGIDKDVYKAIPEDELYARTGIQKQPFNTIYQLMAVKVKQSELLNKAHAMLMIP
nr:rhamnulokinase [Lachnospiraceae bacterium]